MLIIAVSPDLFGEKVRTHTDEREKARIEVDDFRGGDEGVDLPGGDRTKIQFPSVTVDAERRSI